MCIFLCYLIKQTIKILIFLSHISRILGEAHRLFIFLSSSYVIIIIVYWSKRALGRSDWFGVWINIFAVFRINLSFSNSLPMTEIYFKQIPFFSELVWVPNTTRAFLIHYVPWISQFPPDLNIHPIEIKKYSVNKSGSWLFALHGPLMQNRHQGETLFAFCYDYPWAYIAPAWARALAVTFARYFLQRFIFSSIHSDTCSKNFLYKLYVAEVQTQYICNVHTHTHTHCYCAMLLQRNLDHFFLCGSQANTAICFK